MFTPAYHKVIIELSRQNQKFYVIVKKFKNDKFKYHIHTMYCIQAKRLLACFDNDYQLMIDNTIKINTKKGLYPPVDFSMMDKYLYSLVDHQVTPRLVHSDMEHGYV